MAGVVVAATALLRVALAAATQPSALELIEHFGLRVPVATRATSWRPSSASCTGFAVAGDDGGAGGGAGGICGGGGVGKHGVQPPQLARQ